MGSFTSIVANYCIFFTCTVVLDNIKFEHLRCMVEYLYTGRTKILPSELDEYFSAVKRFQILGLTDFKSVDASNTNKTPPERLESNANCSITYELLSGGDDDEVETDQTSEQGRKRKIGQNQNESPPSDLGETPRKLIQNASKRTRTLSNEPENVNHITAAANSPDVDQPSIQPSTRQEVAGSNASMAEASSKQATPSISKPATSSNGKKRSNSKKFDFKCA